MNQAVLKHLHPEYVEVELCRADELAQRRGLPQSSMRCGVMWGRKRNRGGYGMRLSTRVALYWRMCLGDGKDAVLLQLQALLEPFGITRFYTDGWGAYERHIDPEQHAVGKQHTQKIESKHINVRTRIKRLVRRTICFSKTTTMHDLVLGLFINRYEFGRCL